MTVVLPLSYQMAEQATCGEPTCMPAGTKTQTLLLLSPNQAESKGKDWPPQMQGITAALLLRSSWDSSFLTNAAEAPALTGTSDRGGEALYQPGCSLRTPTQWEAGAEGVTRQAGASLLRAAHPQLKRSPNPRAPRSGEPCSLANLCDFCQSLLYTQQVGSPIVITVLSIITTNKH